MHDPQEISLSTLWQLSQAPSLTLTAAACALGWASAAGCGITPDVAAAVATLLLAVLFHAAVNIWAASRHLEAAAPSQDDAWRPGASSHLIAQGRISQQQARQVALALLGLVLLAGLWLALKAGGGLLWIGLAGLLLAWGHSASRQPVASTTLATLCAALAWWLVVLGADYVQRHHFFLIPAADALSFALLTANVALLRHPWLPRWTTASYAALALAAHGWLLGGVWLLVQPDRALWAMLSLPLSLLALALLVTGQPGAAQHRWAFRLTLAAVFCHALVMAVALLSLPLI